MAAPEKYHRQCDVFCIKNTRKENLANVLTSKLGNVMLKIPSKLGKENTFKIGGNVIKKERHFYG